MKDSSYTSKRTISTIHQFKLIATPGTKAAKRFVARLDMMSLVCCRHPGLSSLKGSAGWFEVLLSTSPHEDLVWEGISRTFFTNPCEPTYITDINSTMARFASLLFYFISTVNSYSIWASPDDLPDTIPESCRSALSQNMTCSGGLIKADSLGTGGLPDVWTLSEYCQPDCLSSLEVSTRKNQGKKRLTR